MAYLTSINGAKLGQRHELEKDLIIFGRHPECDVVLEVGAVSRQHARIVRDKDQLKLEDMGSKNGTFLNGQAITGPSVLSDGDLIRICDLEFSFHADADGSFRDTAVRKDSSSTFGVTIYDDATDSSLRDVTNKIDVRATSQGSQLTTTAEVRLKAVLEIVHSLGRAVVVDDVLPKVLDTLFKIFLQADRAFIVLRESPETLVTRCVKTRQADMQESFRISRTVMREVMDTKQAIITLDASSDERFDGATSISDFRIRSMIVAPLLDSDDNPLGAIQLDTTKQNRRFEQSDLEILAAVATQAGLAIENAQLHEQLIEKRLIDKDLELAKKVQQAFLPYDKPQLAGYSFHHFYQPMVQIGGDYYDYVHFADGRLAIVVADVVGHGIAAAMLMAKLSAETRFALANEPTPAAAIKTLNNRICGLRLDTMITFLCLVLEPATGHVTVVSAGHMAPIWKKSKSVVEEPGEEQTGVPLAIMDDYDFEQCEFTLAPGEQLVMYTDGIHEAPNSKGDLFGIAKIKELLTDSESDVTKIGEKITRSVMNYVAGTTQADDMCLVVIGRA